MKRKCKQNLYTAPRQAAEPCSCNKYVHVRCRPSTLSLVHLVQVEILVHLVQVEILCLVDARLPRGTARRRHHQPCSARHLPRDGAALRSCTEPSFEAAEAPRAPLGAPLGLGGRPRAALALARKEPHPLYDAARGRGQGFNDA